MSIFNLKSKNQPSEEEAKKEIALVQHKIKEALAQAKVAEYVINAYMKAER